MEVEVEVEREEQVPLNQLPAVWRPLAVPLSLSRALGTIFNASNN